MNYSVKRIRQRFLKALRSGDYTKGRTKLIQEDEGGNTTYCVLGVLYTISPVKPEHLEGIYDAADTLLGVPKIGNMLWMMNDDTIQFSGVEYTFKDIADTLEEGLFSQYPAKQTWREWMNELFTFNGL
jgi:hypothetical protein